MPEKETEKELKKQIILNKLLKREILRFFFTDRWNIYRKTDLNRYAAKWCSFIELKIRGANDILRVVSFLACEWTMLAGMSKAELQIRLRQINLRTAGKKEVSFQGIRRQRPNSHRDSCRYYRRIEEVGVKRSSVVAKVPDRDLPLQFHHQNTFSHLSHIVKNDIDRYSTKKCYNSCVAHITLKFFLYSKLLFQIICIKLICARIESTDLPVQLTL